MGATLARPARGPVPLRNVEPLSWATKATRGCAAGPLVPGAQMATPARAPSADSSLLVWKRLCSPMAARRAARAAAVPGCAWYAAHSCASAAPCSPPRLRPTYISAEAGTTDSGADPMPNPPPCQVAPRLTAVDPLTASATSVDTRNVRLSIRSPFCPMVGSGFQGRHDGGHALT